MLARLDYPHSLEDRWKEHLKEGESLQRKKKRNPTKIYYDTHLNNAIAKYGKKIWRLCEIDIAYNQNELDKKETCWIRRYDSTNPNKGYNMKEGGKGGKLRKAVKSTISERISEKWKEQEYINKQKEAIKRNRHNPEYKEIVRKAHLKISKFIENKEEFLNDIKNGMTLKELFDKYEMAHVCLLKNIRNILGKYGVKDYRQARRFITRKEFLEDIKNGMLAKDIMKKHRTNDSGLKRLIQNYLGKYGISHYREAKKFLNNKKINNIIKEIEC